MTDLGNQSNKKNILPSEKVCVWVCVCGGGGGGGGAKAPQPHPLLSRCIRCPGGLGGWDIMLLIHVISIHVLLIDVILSPVHVLPVQSLLYNVAHKIKIEITRENDREGGKKERKILSLSPSSFFDLLSYETLSCDQAVLLPLLFERRG